MRRQLVRTTAYAVIAAMLVVLLPLSVLGVWVVTQRPRLVVTWLSQTPIDRSLQLLGGVLVIALVIVAVALALVQRMSRRLAEAARPGRAGAPQLGRVRAEVRGGDRVAGVLTRSARQVTKSLAAERE